MSQRRKRKKLIQGTITRHHGFWCLRFRERVRVGGTIKTVQRSKRLAPIDQDHKTRKSVEPLVEIALEPLHKAPAHYLAIQLGEPDISCSVSVRADGFIAMPLVNKIRVAGLTVQQVQTLVVERLQHFVANPEVTISIVGKVHTDPNFPTLPVCGPSCRPAFSTGIYVLRFFGIHHSTHRTKIRRLAESKFR